MINTFKTFIQELKSPRNRANENQIESPSKRLKDPNNIIDKSNDEISSKNSSITNSPRPRVSKFSLTKNALSR